MKLRKTIQKQIKDKLDCTYFTADDFYIDFDNQNSFGTLIEIEFAHDSLFSFKVIETERNFEVEMKPGEIAEEEFASLENLDEVINAIPKWANEIRHELKADGPIFDQIETLKEYIKESLNVDESNEEFTVDEINELRRKFKGLEKRVIDLEKDKIITETQLQTLKEGITQISSDVEYYPKTTWLKTAPNKLINLVVAIGKSSEGRKVLTDGARKLLGLE